MRRLKPFLMLSLILVITACGLNNTMYNARKYFKSAQERPLNSNGRPSPQAIEEYTKTIQKCGIIISLKKDNRETEEAIYLMAQALYFKGNSAFQAKDQFENLIRLYPESRHIPEANIFLARIYREINQPAEAESRLESFIRNPRFASKHPRALLVLADFEIQDKDYLRAEYWLEKVVTDFANSPEAREAIFLIGKNYYVQKNYAASLEQFQRLLELRRIDKNLRLDALYYLGLNNLELQNYDPGKEAVTNLLKKEMRTDKLGSARVLKARLLIADGQQEAGQQELEAVIRDYPRSPASAAAAYWLGENHFYNRQDRASAQTSYNRVRTESASSEYVALATVKITALQQLAQNTNLNPETNLQQYLDYQYQAADNYFRQFNLPDSSFMIYDQIIARKDSLLAAKQLLETQLLNLSAKTDSLQALKISARVPIPELTDSLAVVQDSSAVAVLDTLDINRQIAGWNTEKQSRENRITNINTSIERFDNDIIPFVRFVAASLHMKLGQKDPEVAEILEGMQRDFPDNRYTNATRMLYNGQRVRVVDPRVEEAEQLYDRALGLYTTEPDSMVTMLTDLLEGPSPELAMQSRFRLGWHYAVERADTLSARPYLEALLLATDTGRYGDLARRIFDGRSFLLRYPGTPVDSSLVQDSTVVIPDSLDAGEALLWDIPEDAEELVGPQPQEEDSISIEMPVYPERREEVPLPEQDPEIPVEPSIEE
jgi:TolA-binding protein